MRRPIAQRDNSSGFRLMSRVLSALGWYLVESEPPVPADIIIVLSGGWNGTRIQYASLLVSQGYAKQVLVSGPLILYGHRETDLAIPWAVQRGFPESIFVAVPIDAYNTEGEAGEMLAAARHCGAKRILVVTNNYHTRRAAAIFSRRAPDLEIHVIAAPDTNFSPDGWWHNRRGRKIFYMEWVSTILYWLGRLSGMFSKSRRPERAS